MPRVRFNRTRHPDTKLICGQNVQLSPGRGLFPGGEQSPAVGLSPARWLKTRCRAIGEDW